MPTNKPDVRAKERHALRVNDATIFSGLNPRIPLQSDERRRATFHQNRKAPPDPAR